MELTDLAARCVAHLQREQTFAFELKQIVQEIRDAMLSRDDARLEKITSSLKQIDFESISNQRHQLRTRIAAVLQIPEEHARVRNLASRCGPETTSEILGQCEQLRQTTQEVASMATANGNLAFQLWEVLERSFCVLSGGNGAPLVYEHTGHRRVA